MDVVFDVAARCCDCRFHLDTSFFFKSPLLLCVHIYSTVQCFLLYDTFFRL